MEGIKGMEGVVGLYGSNSKFAKLKKENEGQGTEVWLVLEC